MTKKTFDINSLFATRTDDKCFEQVLEDTLVEQTLDQQDVIDILETAYKIFTTTADFYLKSKPTNGMGHNFSQSFGGHPSPFLRPGMMSGPNRPFGYGHTGFEDVTASRYPEFFEEMFRHLEFIVRYNDVVLTQSMKFIGVEGEDKLIFLGRDKELTSVRGTVLYQPGNVIVKLHCQERLPVHIWATKATHLLVQGKLASGEITKPGQCKFSRDTRELMNHLRNRAWQDIAEGDLATLVDRTDSPETVFLVGRIDRAEDENGSPAQAVVMPVVVQINGEEVSTVPMGGSIQKVDLMLLKPWEHKG